MLAVLTVILVAIVVQTDQLLIVQLTPSELNIVRQKALDRHNYYRSLHNVSALTLDDTINDVAQNYSVKLGSINQLKHSYNLRYGENLFNYCQYGVANASVYIGK